MLDSTYIHCPGIGAVTERKLWGSGARTWNEYLSASSLSISSKHRAALDPLVLESVERLAARDFAWFARMLPQREHWRAVPFIGDRIAYLDIETRGGMEPSSLTVVGTFDGTEFRQFVRGRNLEEFPESLEGTEMLVTFFGTGFDLPFLRRAYGLEFPQLHVDLCFLLKRLGYRGGLKAIEDRLGIERSEETQGLSGWDAVRLWNLWRAGNAKALEVLLAYNREDVLNMQTLLEWAYPRMLRQTLEETSP
jgi:uncharacterized protein